jgi:lipoic acid synthetase
MVLGNICTRPCGFCAVERGRPALPDADEPERLAEASARLGLKHVVITSVTRDDLPDGGAEHFYRCVLAVRERTGAAVEVLTPDFVHNTAALDRVIDGAGSVQPQYEMQPRSIARFVDQSDFRWTLTLPHAPGSQRSKPDGLMSAWRTHDNC